MKYIVIELQKHAEDADISTIVTTKNTKEEAESTYYSILASAAINNLPVHSAVVLDENGCPVMYKSY